MIKTYEGFLSFLKRNETPVCLNNIKIFEDSQSYVLEDTRDIIRLHLGEIEEIDIIGGALNIVMSDSLKSRIKVYKLTESPNVRDLKFCEQHLNEDIEGVFWNINLEFRIAVIVEGETIESFLGKWIRERYPNPKKHIRRVLDSKHQVFYMDENGSAIFFYYDGDKQDKSVHISFNKIWGFFEVILGLEESQIRKITKDWILSKFGLDLEPKRW